MTDAAIEPKRKGPPRPRRGINNPQMRKMFVNLLGEVELIKAKLAALNFAELPSRRYQTYGERHNSELHGLLYHDLTRAYEQIYTLGMAAGGELLGEARRIAFHRFLNERNEMRYHLEDSIGGDYYFTPADKEALTKELAAARECPLHMDGEPCNAKAILDLQKRKDKEFEQLKATILGLADLTVAEPAEQV